MDILPTRPESETAADLRAADVAYCRRVLLRLIDISADVVETVHDTAREQRLADPGAAPAVDTVATIDRMSRAIRRTMALLLRLHDPVKPAAALPPGRVAVRRRVMRDVEDVIGRDADNASEDADLRAELYERMDSPDLDEEIDTRDPVEIVTELCYDLGIGWNPGTPMARRRTPGQVAELWARAAAGPNQGPLRGPNREQPRRAADDG